MTFTNAAASEMRERILDAIYKKLEINPDDENLQKQITLLNKSSICTIDAFCLEVVRNNFYELENISPNFRIGDTTEIEILKQEIIEDIFEEKYESEDQDFAKLINTYTSYRDDTPLKDLILKIYSYIQSTPFPEEWLEKKVEMFNIKENIEKDFSNTPWGKILLQEVKEEIVDALKSLNEAWESIKYDLELEKFSQTIRHDIEGLELLEANLENWDKSYEIYNNFNFVSWPRIKVESEIKEEVKAIRDNVKNKLKKKLDKILICASKEANEDIYNMYNILIKLKNIILEFGKEFSKRKRNKNLVDFNDIEHLALKILVQKKDGKITKTEVAKRYQEKFIEIAIDEYQDSNLVQENILTSISRGNNIFMVGDVKQSIYKFRQAMPELFMNKYKEYKLKDERNKSEDLKIQLFKNFRSRDNVLNFTNLVFENIMSDELGEIEYNENEYLNLGADYIEANQNLKTEIDIINLKETEISTSDGHEEIEEEKLEDIQVEARYVAKKIRELVDSKFQIYDRKKSAYRNVEYKDIVVLLRSTKIAAPIFEEEIVKQNMPVFSDSSQEYLGSIEIQTIMSLLKIIDNPIQDIPLVTVLRSSIGGFTDNELVEIRLSDKHDNFYMAMKKAKLNVNKELNEKIGKFLNKIDEWRKEQEYLSLDEFIWKIYSDTSYYNYVGLMPNGELRQANLKMLFEKAKQYETASFKGLYNFIRFIEKLELSSGDMGAAKLIGENDNVIRIMSIHKSKGLEFPIVFLSNTGKQFNLMDLNQNILLHQELGIGVKYIDYNRQVQYDTLSKAAIRNKIFIETLSEEMRILYVALTRAKEKIFITGIKTDYEKEIEKMQEQIKMYPKFLNKINPIVLKKYKKYLDWILLVYLYEKNKINELVELNIINKQEAIKQDKNSDDNEVDVMKTFKEHKTDKSIINKLKEKIEYEYQDKIATTMPTMTSVTEIKRIQQELTNEKTIKINNEEVLEEGLKGSNKNKEERNGKEEEEKEKIIFTKPKFLRNDEEETITNIQKGTLIHLCMQNLSENIDYDLNKIKELIQSLEEKEIITHKEKEAINPYKILEFTKSDIWKELKRAKKVYREKPFFINIPAKEIYMEEKLKEKILVQGIIDLYFIDKDDKITLVDYKTDYVEKGKEEVLINRYRKQLELYKRALEEATKLEVKNVYIYSVYLGDVV